VELYNTIKVTKKDELRGKKGDALTKNRPGSASKAHTQTPLTFARARATSRGGGAGAPSEKGKVYRASKKDDLFSLLEQDRALHDQCTKVRESAGREELGKNPLKFRNEPHVRYTLKRDWGDRALNTV